MHSSSSADLQNLLSNPDFVSWAKGERLLDDIFWIQWAAGDPDRQETIAMAKEIVLSLGSLENDLTDEHVKNQVSKALNTAKQIEKDKESQPKRSLSIFRFSAWNIAASAVILLGIGLALFGIHKTGFLKTDSSHLAEAPIESAFTEVTNKNQTVKYVRLSDGSAIVLHKNSRIRFPKKFDKGVREVYLTGDAFFEVAKNPDQPFFVYANELVAKVHGTSFSVKAGARDSKVIVAVKTGKVSVYSKKDAKAGQYKKEKSLAALVLMPNQQATFERNLDRLTRLALRSPVLLNIPIENQEFVYSETPATEVFEALEKAYGIKIDFNREAMSQCSITATLGDEPLENKLKWICTILESEYAYSEDKITIKGNPCK
jgi:ferric-dicitrate binding protein FerR (iron transport regulator)